MNYEIASVGDTIQWSFDGDAVSIFAGKTFSAEVGLVDNESREYGVYAEYGQDYIAFEDAKIINKKQ